MSQKRKCNKTSAAPAILHRDAAGIDIGHRDLRRRARGSRSGAGPVFASLTEDLYTLANWLQQCKINYGCDGIHERVFCAEQRINREGWNPSGPQMRTAVSKSGDHTSLPEKGEVWRSLNGQRRKPDPAKVDLKPPFAVSGGHRLRVSIPVENSSLFRSKIPQPWPSGGLQFRLVKGKQNAAGEAEAGKAGVQPAQE